MNQLRHDQVTDQDIENFINYFYKNEAGDNNLQAFIRIFKMYESKMRQDEDEAAEEGVKKKMTIVLDETIKQKKEFYD